MIKTANKHYFINWLSGFGMLLDGFLILASLGIWYPSFSLRILMLKFKFKEK